MKTKSKGNRWFLSLSGIILLLTFTACEDDEGTIVINSVLEETQNSPPSIIVQGPDFGPGSLEVIVFDDDPPEFFVLVADPNGLEDISIVFLAIESLIVHDLIVRPDSSTSTSCNHAPSYTNPDTIDIMPLISSVFSGVKNIPMEPLQGGLYTSPPLCYSRAGYETISCPTFPDISKASSTFSRTSKCAGFIAEYFHFDINRPAPDTAINVFVTYVDVEYAGISVIVYDAAGTNATALFPNLRVVYSTVNEFSNAP